ncbi:MAG: hypothetical protein AAGA42_02445 [Actinomycetota bacterium]
MSASFEPTRDDVVELLGQVYKPEGVEIWLASPNRLLDGRVPTVLLEEGDYDAVYDVVEQLVTGGYA